MEAARPTFLAAGFAARHWYRLSPVSELLFPVSLVFRLLVALRRLLFRAGALRSVRLHVPVIVVGNLTVGGDRKSTRLNSSHGYISYAVFCLKKKKNI